MNPVDDMIRLFKKNLVLRLKEVMEYMNRSRTSIIRYLNETGYFASYNHAGEFYTLKTIPEFDSYGLWKYKDAYFSQHGSLRDTAIALVEKSENGYTHSELREMLGLRMYNTLLDLANEGLIIRNEHNGEFVYVSCEQGEMQISARRNMPKKIKEKKAAAKRAPRITPAAGLNETIEVLLAFINGHTEPSSVYGYLHRKGILVTPKQIQAIFECYDLGKKNSC